jgi:hypothetical protein
LTGIEKNLDTLSVYFAPGRQLMKPPSSSNILETNDWRLQTFTYLADDWISPWSGTLSPKGTRITASSVIALTKKAANYSIAKRICSSS